MTEITTINLSGMPNGAHFTYHSNRVYPQAYADTNVKSIAATQLTAYHTAIQAEDAALKLSQKSLLSDNLGEADKQRDYVYSKFRQSVKSYLDFPEAEIALAAKTLNQALKDYAIEPAMQMDKETGLLVNLIQDMEEKHAAHVTTLNLGLFVTQLKKYNEQVIALTTSRTEERVGITAGAMKAARRQVDDAYRQLIKVVNAYIIVEGDTKYKAFADYMNTLIREYKINVLGQKAPATPTPGPDSGDGSGDGDSESPDEI